MPGGWPFANTLVVFMHPVENMRRTAEAYLVARIGPDCAVASYTVIIYLCRSLCSMYEHSLSLTRQEAL